MGRRVFNTGLVKLLTPKIVSVLKVVWFTHDLKTMALLRNNLHHFKDSLTFGVNAVSEVTKFH